jgi:hypothetical protein
LNLRVRGLAKEENASIALKFYGIKAKKGLVFVGQLRVIWFKESQNNVIAFKMKNNLFILAQKLFR